MSARTLIHLLILRPALRLLFGVSIDGRDHLKGLDRFIVAANHNSHLDVLLLFCALPWRRIDSVRPVAARDYFERRRVLFGIVDYLFRPVWIRRGESARKALAAMHAALEAGQGLIIFPEGTRGTPGSMARFHTGVGRLAEVHRDVPVLPVFLHGPERALPRHGAVPLPVWNRVVIGPPRRFGTGCRDIASSLEQMIQELSESETGHRHRRTRRSRRCLTLAVLGIDGSGKSTLSRRVCEKLSRRGRVVRVSDDLEFYEKGTCTALRSLPSEKVRHALSRYAKTARSLKHYKIPKLAELLLRDHLLGEVRRWHAPNFAVTDGSPLINMTAWARLYRKELGDPRVSAAAIRILTGHQARLDPALKLPELSMMRRLRVARLHLPDAVVMLDVDPVVSMQRIRKRGERVQAHETEEKLDKLRQGYLMVCEVIEREFAIPVRVLGGELNVDDLTSATLGFLSDISKPEASHVA